MAYGRHVWLATAVVGIAAVVATCREPGVTATQASTGTGEGGCPPVGPPAPLFTLKVTAMRGPLPSDTTLRVRWSAGDEPELVLSDPNTWQMAAERGTVVCDLPADAGPPSDLLELTCELWTSGATEIEVSASDYVTHNETLTPKEIDGCDKPVPSEVAVELVPDLDAGTAR